ncbi:hypothetical protein [Bacillus thuringiensis]|uniref:hypothetical protein n=1 Tax=Bacillus thuringiensis TaxID=1428 RepID=UPI0026E23B92|nr:hypothetical protein [Bacillus thuringiensis]MDO6698794.1 hypothetical protein [Bacillus thuringiensis]
MIKQIEEALQQGSITELEAKVLNFILTRYEIEDGFPQEFKQTAKELSMEFNSLKGVVGSLKKKDYIRVENYHSGYTDQWIHATDKSIELAELSWAD